jgi:hypothetical protein
MVVTHQVWSFCFITGAHLQACKIRKPDGLLTINVLHEIHNILSREWSQALTPATKKRAVEMTAWVVTDGLVCHWFLY